MNESEYLHRVDAVFQRILSACEAVDPDDVDAYAAGDVLTLTFRDRSRCVVNTQRPTRQVWLAADSRAWHFSYDEPTGRWLDDKGRGNELFATIRETIARNAGVTVTLP